MRCAKDLLLLYMTKIYLFFSIMQYKVVFFLKFFWEGTKKAALVNGFVLYVLIVITSLRASPNDGAAVHYPTAVLRFSAANAE